MASLLGETPVETGAAPVPAANVAAAVGETEAEDETGEDAAGAEGDAPTAEVPTPVISAAVMATLTQTQASLAIQSQPAGETPVDPAAPGPAQAKAAAQPPPLAPAENTAPVDEAEIDPTFLAETEAWGADGAAHGPVRAPGRPTSAPATAAAPQGTAPAADLASDAPTPAPQAAAKETAPPAPAVTAEPAATATAPAQAAQAQVAQAQATQIAQPAPATPAAKPAESAARADKSAKSEGKPTERTEAFAATTAGPARGATPTQTPDAVAAAARPEGAAPTAAETAEADVVAAPDSPDALVAAEPDAPASGASTTAAAPAPHPVRGSPETVAALSAQILKKLDARTTRFDIELDPLGLGKVDVRVEIGAHGRLTAALSFETPQAAQELKARAGELQRALEQAGFDMSGGMSFDVADQGQGRQGLSERQHETGSAFRGRAFRAALDTADQADTAPAGRLNLRRGVTAGLDVRI